MAKRPKDVEGRPELPPGARRRGKSIQVRVYRGYDAATGRRLQATETVATPEEAWKVWAKLTEQVQKGEYIPLPGRPAPPSWRTGWRSRPVRT